MEEEKQTPTVDPGEYTDHYYLTDCGGYQEFIESRGFRLNPRHEIAFSLANIQPGQNVLDIGCGRGEIVVHATRKGASRAWGLDYAGPAVRIANQNIQANADTAIKERIAIQQSNAKYLPFESDRFDYAFMLDVVEHLYPEELDAALAEAYRVLRPGGFLIVHTAPSLWYYRYGYPLFRFVQRLRGVRLPKNPRDRWPYSHVHVNEQDPIRLDRTLRKAGFKVKTRLISFQTYQHEKNRTVRRVMKILSGYYPFKILFCDDIYGIAKK